MLFEKRKLPMTIDIENLSSTEVRTVLETNLRRFEEEAIAKGRQEGIQQKALEVAKNLKENGVELAIIAKATGFSEEELKKL
jgi:predicted transposase/invertase (TIGR01784 family)